MIEVGHLSGGESQVDVNLHSFGCFARLTCETDDMGGRVERQIGKLNVNKETARCFLRLLMITQ